MTGTTVLSPAQEEELATTFPRTGRVVELARKTTGTVEETLGEELKRPDLSTADRRKILESLGIKKENTIPVLKATIPYTDSSLCRVSREEFYAAISHLPTAETYNGLTLVSIGNERTPDGMFTGVLGERWGNRESGLETIFLKSAHGFAPPPIIDVRGLHIPTRRHPRDEPFAERDSYTGRVVAIIGLPERDGIYTGLGLGLIHDPNQAHQRFYLDRGLANMLLKSDNSSPSQAA